MTFRLLACDGGGIRGYLTAKLIQKLDQATAGQLLGKSDGYAGTSTGGLIAIGLAAGVKIGKMVDIYANDAAKIFTANPHYLANAARYRLLAAASQPELAGPGVLECAYTAEGLCKVMTPLVGDRTLGQITDKLLVVPAAQLHDARVAPPRWMPAILCNQRMHGDHSAVRLIDVALATSAAPTYFPPHDIPGLGYFADGGTFANNPVLNGVEAALTSGLASGLDDLSVISIGTGLSPQSLTPKTIGDPLDWGAFWWMNPTGLDGVPPMALLDLALTLSAQNAGMVTKRLLSRRMVRLQPVLSSPVPLDGHSAGDYRIMDKAIDQVENSPAWQSAIALVKAW